MQSHARRLSASEMRLLGEREREKQEGFCGDATFEKEASNTTGCAGVVRRVMNNGLFARSVIDCIQTKSCFRFVLSF